MAEFDNDPVAAFLLPSAADEHELVRSLIGQGAVPSLCRLSAMDALEDALRKRSAERLNSARNHSQNWRRIGDQAWTKSIVCAIEAGWGDAMASRLKHYSAYQHHMVALASEQQARDMARQQAHAAMLQSAPKLVAAQTVFVPGGLQVEGAPASPAAAAPAAAAGAGAGRITTDAELARLMAGMKVKTEPATNADDFKEATRGGVVAANRPASAAMAARPAAAPVARPAAAPVARPAAAPVAARPAAAPVAAAPAATATASPFGFRVVKRRGVLACDDGATSMTDDGDCCKY